MFTKAPTASMLMLLKTLMDGTATVPLLARLYQLSVTGIITSLIFSVLDLYINTHIIFSS